MSSRRRTPSVQNCTRVTPGWRRSRIAPRSQPPRRARRPSRRRLRGHRLRGDAPWLGARHHTTPGGPPSLDEVLRHLRRLAASRLPHQHCRRARLHEVQDGVAALEDGKTFPRCAARARLSFRLYTSKRPPSPTPPRSTSALNGSPASGFLPPGFQNAMTRSPFGCRTSDPTATKPKTAKAL